MYKESFRGVAPAGKVYHLGQRFARGWRLLRPLTRGGEGGGGFETRHQGWRGRLGAKQRALRDKGRKKKGLQGGQRAPYVPLWAGDLAVRWEAAVPLASLRSDRRRSLPKESFRVDWLDGRREGAGSLPKDRHSCWLYLKENCPYERPPPSHLRPSSS